MIGTSVWRDWRVWLLIAAVLLIAVVDALVPPDLPLFSFMLIPVVASARLGRPMLTATLTLMGLLLAGVLLQINNYPAALFVSRVVLIGVSGGIAMVLAEVSRRSEAARAAADNELVASEEQFRLLAENSVDVVVRVDPNGDFTYLSPSVRELLGYRPDELMGSRARSLVHPEDVEAASAVVERLGSEDQGVFRSRFRRSDGSFVWVDSTARTLHDSDGLASGRIATWRNADAEVAASREAAHLARTDPLTGVPNRRAAMDHLSRICHQQRHPGDIAAVLFVDLDGFKSVNDTYGHAAGDVLLQAVTQRMADCLRSGDVITRTGGDEFVVILDGLHNSHESVALAQRIVGSVSLPIEASGATFSSTVSVGVAIVGAGENPEEVLARADSAMYRAKAKGGNQVVADSVG